MSSTDAQTTPVTGENTHATYTDDEVRVEEDPANLENAAPAHGSTENVQVIMSEAGGVGGSDNTAGPAGGNSDHPGKRETVEQVAQSDMAQTDYQSETGTDPGV